MHKSKSIPGIFYPHSRAHTSPQPWGAFKKSQGRWEPQFNWAAPHLRHLRGWFNSGNITRKRFERKIYFSVQQNTEISKSFPETAILGNKDQETTKKGRQKKGGSSWKGKTEKSLLVLCLWSIGLECERAALIFTQQFKSGKCFSNPEQFLSELCFWEANIPVTKTKNQKGLQFLVQNVSAYDVIKKTATDGKCTELNGYHSLSPKKQSSRVLKVRVLTV